MGVQSEDNRGRTYGLIGKTPAIKVTGKRFRCSMISSITNEGDMRWMVYTDKFDADKFICYLKRLAYKARRKIILIADGHPVHRSKKVDAYLLANKDKIEIEILPAYCPELNPQEYVNQDVKANACHFKVITSLDDLLINIRYYLTKIQYNQFKVMSFFKKKEVQYAGWFYSDKLSLP